MTARNFHELWSNGAPLNVAWIDFSSDGFDQEKFRILQRSPLNDFDNPDTRRLGSWLPNTIEGRQAKLWHIEQFEKLDLFERLYQGALWAIGFRLKPSRREEPERVPRDLFYVESFDEICAVVASWSKGELQFRDEAFFDIRVIESPSEPEDFNVDRTAFAQQPDMADAVSPKRTGRKNMRARIKAKARELWHGDPNFKRLPSRTHQAREVKAQVLGEDARNADDMPECKLQSAIRWVGEALNETTDPSA